MADDTTSLEGDILLDGDGNDDDIPSALLYNVERSNSMSFRTLERDVYAIISNSLQQQACDPPVLAIAQGLPHQKFAMMASQSQHGVFAHQRPLQMSVEPDHNTNDTAKVLNGLSRSECGATNKLVGSIGGNEERIKASMSFMLSPNVASFEKELEFKRARNRVYAKKSRARKQCEVAKMQDRLTKLQNENDMLEALLSRVVVENTSEDDEEASASV